MLELKKIKRESEWNVWYDITPVISNGGVYMLYDKNDYLIYIGQSQNINQRLQTHCKNDNKDWDYARVIIIDNRYHRLTIEKLLIGYMNPHNNKSEPSCLNVSFNLDSSKLIEMQKISSKSILAIDTLRNLIQDYKRKEIINSEITKSIHKEINKFESDIIHLNYQIASYLNFSDLGKRNNY
jgi:hypothetical protein